MVQKILVLVTKLFLGRGIDKKFPFIVNLYKKIFSLLTKEGEVVVDIPLDLKLAVSNKDSGLGMYLRTKGEFEPIQTRIFLDSLRNGLTVFDIGANVGYYTVLASKKVGSKGRVFAFEPDPRNLLFLKKNLALNKCKNVVVVNQALSDKNGYEVFNMDLANPGESRLTKDQNSKTKVQKSNFKNNSISVRTITLDNFLTGNRIKKIDVIKMDIEGGEIDALLGGAKILKSLKNVKLIFECNKEALNNFGETPENLIREIKHLGFKVKEIINEFNKKRVDYSDKKLNSILENVSYVSIMGEK